MTVETCQSDIRLTGSGYQPAFVRICQRFPRVTWVSPGAGYVLFYLPVLPLYGFTKLYTNPFLLIYLLPNFKLPVLVLFWGLK
jgi:hypothetical protein